MSGILQVLAPVTLEEQVNTLRAAVIALGKTPWTLYDEIVDGLEALGETARDAYASVVSSLSKEDGKMYASQMVWLAGLTVKQNLPSLTSAEAYIYGRDALYESHKDLAMTSIDRVLEAATAPNAIEQLDALVEAATIKRDGKRKIAADKKAAAVMEPDSLAAEVHKFRNAYGDKAFFALVPDITVVEQ